MKTILNISLLLAISFSLRSQDIIIEAEKLLEKEDDPAETHQVKFDTSFKVTFTKNKAVKNIVLKKSDDDVIQIGVTKKNEDIIFTFVPKNKKLELTYKDKKDAIKNESIDQNFTLIYGNKTIAFIAEIPPKRDAATEPVKSNDQKIYYWKFTESAAPADKSIHSLPMLDLTKFMFKSPETCNDYEPCDNDIYINSNRIIYDAKTGITYYLKAGEKTDKFCNIQKQSPTPTPTTATNNNVSNQQKGISSKSFKPRRIVVNSEQRLLYIVRNVNPYNYDIKLFDSAIFTNNISNELLETILFTKSETTTGFAGDIQGSKDAEEQKKDPQAEQDYLAIKSALIVARAQMIQLITNFKNYSPYVNNCINEKKKGAVAAINEYTSQINGGKYKNMNLLDLKDVFLSQLPQDTLLFRQTEALYNELTTTFQEISHPYPMIPQKDILNFNLSIVAKDGSAFPSLLKPSKQHPTQTVYIKNFFKIDISTGIYLAGKKDQVYSLVEDSTFINNKKNGARDSILTTKRIVNEKTPDPLEFGFGSFVHFYYKLSPGFNFGATIGAGLSFSETVRVRYFTGASILLGKENRVCINGGILWGNYKELSRQYEMEDAIQFKELKSDVNELKYVTRFGYAPFISISYNLPFIERKSKQKAVPGT